MRLPFLTVFLTAVCGLAVSPAAAQSTAPCTMNLDQAVARALALSPALAAGSFAVSAAEARITQAGLLPNPELELQAENFGGGADLNGFSGAESTLVISQPILLGGQRARRKAVAEAEHQLAGRGLEGLRLSIAAATTAAFSSVLAAERREGLAGELLELAEQFADTVHKRVDGGKVSPVEATRAGMEVARARIERIRAARELEAARAHLAATWGSPTADSCDAVGTLPAPSQLPSIEELRGLLGQTPEMRGLEDRIGRQQGVVELEEALRIPNLALSVGPRRFEATGQSAWGAGMSLPLPIFDKNQGTRTASRFELERVRRDAESIRSGLEAELVAVLARLLGASEALRTLDDEVVPAAQAAFIATQTGYSEGKFGFLDVLDAQRTLFEARSVALAGHEEYALGLAALEGLVGPIGNKGDR